MALSRRDFLAASALAGGSTLLPRRGAAQSAPAGPLTVGAVINRIKANTGVPWRTPTVDRLVFGSEEIGVHGIATTMMSTFDVCKRAQAAGANLILTHEPTFYKHEDDVEDLKSDPVVRAKQAFLAQHEMAIFRLHDNLHAMHPDGVARGMMEQLGWQRYATDTELHRFHFDGVPLARLAEELATKLHATTIRVVGDPELAVHSVQANWGYASRERGIPQLADPAVEVLICGEAREWELVEYAQDAITAGEKKALIVLGHVLSEQGGMIWAASWLKGFVREVPITFVPASEPFWRPDQPRC